MIIEQIKKFNPAITDEVVSKIYTILNCDMENTIIFLNSFKFFDDSEYLVKMAQDLSRVGRKN